MWTAVLTTLSKRLWQKAEFLRSTSESDKKLAKKIFSLNGSFRHVEHISDNPSEKVMDKKPKILCSVFKKDWKDEICSGKIFSSKCSSRRVKRSFDNPVENISRKSPNFFAEAPKETKKGFQKRKLLTELFLWTRWKRLWQPRRKVFARKTIFFVWIWERDKQKFKIFVQKTF